MTQLAGGFRVMNWEEETYDEPKSAPRPAQHPKFTHVRATHELTGHIQGEASVCYLMAYRPDETAHFVGLVMVTGAIGSEEGTFLMQDVGTFENGIAKGRWTILNGYGSGDLRKLRGDGHFAASHEGASYLLDVSF